MNESINRIGQSTLNGQQSRFIPTMGQSLEEPLMTKRMNTEELRNAELRGEQVSISERQLLSAIEKAVKQLRGPYTYLEFSVHEATRQIAVKVHDKETGEVIREIPPEKTLDFVAKLWEMAGILVDERR